MKDLRKLALLAVAVAIGLVAVPAAGAHSIPATKPVAVQDIKSKLWQGEYQVSNASCKPVKKSRAGRVDNKPAFRHHSCVVRVEGDGAQDPTVRWKFRYHATGRRLGRYKATSVRKQCRTGNRWKNVRENTTCLPPSGGGAECLAPPSGYGPFGICELVSFAPGTDRIVVSGGVVRGTVNVYVIGAAADQGMILQLDSPEAVKSFGLAVMDVYSPNGTLLASGTQFFGGELTESGDYFVVVQSSAGNAGYDLDIVIQ